MADYTKTSPTPQVPSSSALFHAGIARYPLHPLPNHGCMSLDITATTGFRAYRGVGSDQFAQRPPKEARIVDHVSSATHL